MLLSNTLKKHFPILVSLLLLCSIGCTNQVNYPTQNMETDNVVVNASYLTPMVFPDEYSKKSNPYIEKYHIDVRVEGLYAQVTTDVTFRNPRGFTWAVFELPLPEGAVVSGYAFDIDNTIFHHQMVDASIVDVNAAFINHFISGLRSRNSDDTIRDPNVDVAKRAKLLKFRASIGYMFSHSYRQIRVQYIMPLVVDNNDVSSIELPIVRSNLIERKIRIHLDIPGTERPVIYGLKGAQLEKVQNAWEFECTDQKISSDSDLRLTIPDIPKIVSNVERYEKDPNETFFSINIRPTNDSNPETVRDLSHLRLIWDASGSRTPEVIQQARQVLEKLPETGHYELHVFRNVIESPVTFRNRAELLKYIDALDYDGGTNFASLKGLSNTKYDGMTLLFTDGLNNYSNDIPEFGAHSAAVISESKNQYGTDLMKHVCGGQVYHTNSLSAEEIIRQLKTPQPMVSQVEGEYITDVEGIGASASNRFTIIGKLRGNSDTVKIILSDGTEYQVNISSDKATTGNILAKAWALSKIGRLSLASEMNRGELIALSHKYSIAAPGTMMIILDEYEKFSELNVEPPKSLSEIHERWLKEHNNTEIINQQWDERAEWYNNPIPKNIMSVYECENGDLTQCEENIISDIDYNHYRKPFTPPDGWKCTRENLCNVLKYARLEYFPSRNVKILDYVYWSVQTKYYKDPYQESTSEDDDESDQALEMLNDEKPWRKVFRDLKSDGADAGTLYAEYIRQRKVYHKHVEFYIDLAYFFFSQNYKQYAFRILSNLGEIQIHDASLLYAYAYILRDFGELDDAIEIMQSVANMRGYDRLISYYLATVYEQRGKQNLNAGDIQAALNYYYKAAFDSNEPEEFYKLSVKPGAPDDVLPAIDRFNVLAAWSKRQNWPTGAPVIPKIDEKYSKVYDADLYVVIQSMLFSEDNISIIEPTTEELFPMDARFPKSSTLGGRHVEYSKFGPSTYFLKNVSKGEYTIHAETYIDEETNQIPQEYRAIVYKNWGRPNQSEEVVVLRSDTDWDLSDDSLMIERIREVFISLFKDTEAVRIFKELLELDDENRSETFVGTFYID